MLSDSLRIEDGKLEENLAPILHAASPFAGDIHRRQVQHFEQRFVRWEAALAFGHFAQLTMAALDHVRRID